MNDMRAVIVPKSDQINADDLLAGPMTITVTSVNIKPGTEQPVAMRFEGDGGKPYKPCKSMARVLVNCWGPDASVYAGRSMTLYCDPKVTWAGMAVGGIRISHLSHIEQPVTMALTASKGNKKLFTVHPLVKPKDALQAAQDAPKKRTMADWLAELETELAAMTDAGQIEERTAKTDVQAILSGKDGSGKDRCAALIDAAKERVANALGEPPPREPGSDG